MSYYEANEKIKKKWIDKKINFNKDDPIKLLGEALDDIRYLLIEVERIQRIFKAVSGINYEHESKYGKLCDRATGYKD